MTVCAVCSGDLLPAAFAADYRGRRHASHRCPSCGLYQTVGEIAAVSPDYVGLSDGELDADHRFLQTAHKAPAFRQWARLMARHGAPLHRGKTLLEPGCGIGGFFDFAAAAGLVAYGFDASAAQVAAAQGRHPNVALATRIADYVGRGGMPRKFDYAALWDVFEHLREPEQFLADLRPCLAADGLLYLSLPNAAPVAAKLWLARVTGRPIAEALIPWEHVFYHSTRSLARLFTATGWQFIATGGVATYLRPPSASELARRAVHGVLRDTRYALQIYAVARPRA